MMKIAEAVSNYCNLPLALAANDRGGTVKILWTVSSRLSEVNGLGKKPSSGSSTRTRTTSESTQPDINKIFMAGRIA